VTGILCMARVRYVLLLVGMAFVALPAGSALADTTVGQTGPPVPSVWSTNLEIVQTSAPIPAAGTVTSFSTQSGTCPSGAVGTYDFQVLRPLGANQYQVLADTGNHTDPCDGNVHSFAVNIPVEAGDFLGAYTVGNWQGIVTFGSGSDLSVAVGIAQPAVGDVVTARIDVDPTTLDESANLVTLPTSKGQCKNGGWHKFGTTFKNQGDCVSFVATGGTNPPSGS
jgi:hypothetical protein